MHKFEQTTRRYIFTTIQRVAVGATSADASPVETTEVLLHPTVDCFVNIGGAATTSKLPLVGGEKFHLQLEPGSTISVIRASTDGYLFIIPVY